MKFLGWANRIHTSKQFRKKYNDKYFKEQLYLRLIRLIKMKKEKVFSIYLI